MPSKFSRATLMAAVKLLARHSHGEFNVLALEFGVQGELPAGPTPNLLSKAAIVGRHVMEHPDAIADTQVDPVTLGELLVRRALTKFGIHSENEEDNTIRRALALDGYGLVPNEVTGGAFTQPMVPQDMELITIDDEVHTLLKKLKLEVSLGHLDQAIGAFRKGNWASANSQLRSFLEAMIKGIARDLFDAPETHTLENCLNLLAAKKLLLEERNEWRGDGKGYTNGLFKWLHTEGAHPGLSDEDDCTSRLHIVLVTARMYLRRLKNGSD